MFQRELFIIVSLLAAVTLAVAGLGWYAISKLHETSRLIVADTLPGLTYAGLAEERIHDNRHKMHELLTPHTSSERESIILSIKANNTDTLWLEYKNSIFATEDRQSFQTLMEMRSNYLQSCDRFYTLVDANKIDGAKAFYYGDLSDRFQKYKTAAKNLFDYNVKQGFIRGNTVIRSISLAPWLISVFCILIFMGGVILGLRTGLSGVR